MERKRLTKAERREQILKAAETVFVKKGYNGSTTLEIAKEADISEVTLFRYFSSKQEIFLEVIEPILLKTLEENINTARSLGIKEKLEFILTERILLVSKNNQILSLILKERTFLQELGKEDLVMQFWQLFKRFLLVLEIPQEAIEINTRILMGSILSFLYQPENDVLKIKNYVKEIVSIIINYNRSDK